MRPILVGPIAAVATQIVIVDYLSAGPIAIYVNVNGVLTYSVEYTYDDVNNAPPYGVQWLAVSALAAQTASKDAVLSLTSVFALRLDVTAYTSGVGAYMRVLQASGSSALAAGDGY